MTIDQIDELFGHERDEHGCLVPQFDDSEVEPTPYDKFAAYWSLRGLKEDKVRLLWREKGEIDAELDRINVEIAKANELKAQAFTEDMQRAGVPGPEAEQRLFLFQEQLGDGQVAEVQRRLAEFKAEQFKRRK